ncbi:hypothetical protein AURDEDRAFT_171509 [Auricularia subglabra TFB-10046 SS5]|nr:hypothetical protein AURDEDRAFT_171509 [Auricularia subglabra TFB-10046 SS5]
MPGRMAEGGADETDVLTPTRMRRRTSAWARTRECGQGEKAARTRRLLDLGERGRDDKAARTRRMLDLPFVAAAPAAPAEETTTDAAPAPAPTPTSAAPDPVPACPAAPHHQSSVLASCRHPIADEEPNPAGCALGGAIQGLSQGAWPAGAACCELHRRRRLQNEQAQRAERDVCMTEPRVLDAARAVASGKDNFPIARNASCSVACPRRLHALIPPPFHSRATSASFPTWTPARPPDTAAEIFSNLVPHPDDAPGCPSTRSVTKALLARQHIAVAGAGLCAAQTPLYRGLVIFPSSLTVSPPPRLAMGLTSHRRRTTPPIVRALLIAARSWCGACCRVYECVRVL